MIKRRSRDEVLRDSEVIELLRNDPELLAIADTIHATLGKDYRGRVRRRIVRVGILALVLCTAVLLAFVQPWSSGDGLVSEALAAIPNHGSVVHMVLESSVPGTEVVNVRDGHVEPERVASEFWFDQRRGLLHTVIRRQGAVVADVVTTPAKTTSVAGPVLGQASTTLEPALVAFASGYRVALASGAARPLARTSPTGRSAPTLEVTTPLGREQVTLDPATLLPREIRPVLSDGRLGRRVIRVVTLSTQSARPGEFEVRPKP